MSWNAPAAMYFVISVLPISMTSGALPPASVASNFWRWFPHVWYCTLTATPGCSRWNAALAALTIGSQFAACASTWSQTVMLFVAAAPPDAVAAITARAAPTRTAAPMMRALMSGSPKRIERRRRIAWCARWPAGTTMPEPPTGVYHLATVRKTGTAWSLVKTTLRPRRRVVRRAFGVFPGCGLRKRASASRSRRQRRRRRYWY